MGRAVARRLRASTLAWFQTRAPRAVSESAQRAARMPGTLFAARHAPVPVQHMTTASPAAPVATASAAASVTAGQFASAPAAGPKYATVWPRAARSASTASTSGVRSSALTAIRMRPPPGVIVRAARSRVKRGRGDLRTRRAGAERLLTGAAQYAMLVLCWGVERHRPGMRAREGQARQRRGTCRPPTLHCARRAARLSRLPPSRTPRSRPARTCCRSG